MTADAAPRWTTALLTVLVAVSLAQLTWRLWPAPTLPEPPPPRPAAASAPDAGRESPLQQAQRVAALHLFGAPSERSVPARPDVRDAPETQLDLTLHGVVATGDPVTARAIIQHGGGKERPYRLGDEIPGGAVIREILTDRVVLERNGRYETLRLPRQPLSSVAGPDDGATADTRLRGRLQDYRQRLLREPSKVDRLLRVQPVTEGGRLKGYRLDPRADRELFRAAGLQAGDVLTGVNGMQLDDPTRLGEVIDQLSTAERLTLTVERGGRLETVVIRLGDRN